MATKINIKLFIYFRWIGYLCRNPGPPNKSLSYQVSGNEDPINHWASV